MYISSGDIAFDTRRFRSREATTETSQEANPLELLLDCSIRLRDLYRHARLRTGDSLLQQLRLLFESHYKEQVRLVDVLVERLRIIGGAGRIFAGTFLQDPGMGWDPRTRHALVRMLRTLLDAHELVLGFALLGEEKKDEAWIRDLAVGQVVLANEQQSRSICDLLGNRSEDPRMLIPFQWTSD